MTLSGILSKLQCSHDQLVCPLQNITCQCVVTGAVQTIRWTLHSEIIAQFDISGKALVSNPNYPATIEILETGQSSNVSFVAELQPGLSTIECTGFAAHFNSSYSIIGLFFFEIFILPNQSIKYNAYFLVMQSRQIHQSSIWLWL